MLLVPDWEKIAEVSILTLPEGRVQLTLEEIENANATEFQSSPVPKDGCNRRLVEAGKMRRWFQSSPVPKDGCNSCATGRGTR